MTHMIYINRKFVQQNTEHVVLISKRQNNKKTNQ